MFNVKFWEFSPVRQLLIKLMWTQYDFTSSHVLVVLGKAILELRKSIPLVDLGVQGFVLHQFIAFAHGAQCPYALRLEVSREEETLDLVASADQEQGVDFAWTLFGEGSIENAS